MKVFRIFISHDYRIVKVHFLTISDFMFRNPCSTLLTQVSYKFRPVLNSALSHEDTRYHSTHLEQIREEYLCLVPPSLPPAILTGGSGASFDALEVFLLLWEVNLLLKLPRPEVCVKMAFILYINHSSFQLYTYSVLHTKIIAVLRTM
jgi:hypothetical protein